MKTWNSPPSLVFPRFLSTSLPSSGSQTHRERRVSVEGHVVLAEEREESGVGSSTEDRVVPLVDGGWVEVLSGGELKKDGREVVG